MAIFTYDQLYKFTHDMLIKIGCPEVHAQIGAEVLLSADMRGVDSHGVARLSGY
ncbi:MAG TPA: malate dehydrogenase, partial [Algoriphagus sp.]|nr:malate dehydrogenase [Algoriphagus sp.]